MAFYNEFPHTRNYDDDLRQLICMYKKLGQDYDTLIKIYEQVKNDIQDITVEQLQKWLDDGTLESLISASLMATKITHYANVAEMISDSTLAVGNVAFTESYYANAKGGGGFYRIIERGSEENIGDHIYLNNGLTAELIQRNKQIDLAQYGIKEGAENDNADIINYAINQFKDATTNLLNCGVLTFPIGTFYIKKQINLIQNLLLEGTFAQTVDSNVGTTLYFDPPSPTNLFTHSEDVEQYSYIFNVNFKDLEIVGGEQANILLDLSNVARSYVENVTTKHGSVSVRLNYNMDLNISNCHFLYPHKIGILCDNNKIPTTTTQIENTYIGNAATYDSYPLWVTRSATNGLWFKKCTFESTAHGLIISTMNNVNFDSCYFENLPITAGESLFKIGMLIDESSIASGEIDNLTAPIRYYQYSNTIINNSFFQINQYGKNGAFIDVAYAYIVAINDSCIESIQKVIGDATLFTNQVAFNNTQFRTINQAPANYSKYYYLNNCYVNDSLLFYTGLNLLPCIITSDNNLSATNWYRILEFDITKISTGVNLLLSLSSSYENNTPQMAIIAVSMHRYSANLLTKLSGTTAGIIDQVRISQNGNLRALEVHYNVDTANDVRADTLFQFNPYKLDVTNDNFIPSNWTAVTSLTL